MKTTKKVLITGAAGFIGYHLFKKLKEGNIVVGLDNFYHPCGAVVDCKRGDVRDQAVIDDLVRNVDEIYHLAAQVHVDRSYEEPQLTYDVNVGGTNNILMACKKHGKKLIFASSCEVYGTAQTECISEEHPLNPQSPYARSKKEAEGLCIDFAKKVVRVVIVRGFNTYGPFQNNNSYGAVIPIFVKRILNGESPLIFGDGTQTRDFMYINDSIQSYLIASERANFGEPLNFGTAQEISINDLAALLLNLLGKDGLQAVHVEPRPNEVMRFKADISRAGKLGFNPRVTIRQGLEIYLNWLQTNRTEGF